MTTLVKIHRNGQMTLPSSFRTAMGVGDGSLVELSLKNGKTVIAAGVGSFQPRRLAVESAEQFEGHATTPGGEVDVGGLR